MQMQVVNVFVNNDPKQRADALNEKLKEIIKRGEIDKKEKTAKAGN